jgi:hypothetical protein
MAFVAVMSVQPGSDIRTVRHASGSAACADEPNSSNPISPPVAMPATSLDAIIGLFPLLC